MQEIVGGGLGSGGLRTRHAGLFRALGSVVGAGVGAIFAAERAARLGLGLERFPDHRRFGIFAGREGAEHALAGDPVDPHHANPRRRDERRLGHVLKRDLRKLLEHRPRNPPALGIAAHRARPIIAEIDAGNDVGRAADEPHIGRARGGPGLAEQWPVEVAQHGRGAALDHAFENVDHLVRSLRLEQLSGADRRSRHRLAIPVGGVATVHHFAAIVGAINHLATPILDEVDDRRPHFAPVIGEHRISIGQLHHRRIAGAERDRQIIGIIADAELGGVGDHLGHAGLRRGSDGHQVARLLDPPAHRLGAGITAVEVAKAFIAQPCALPHTEGCIDDDRRRGHAIFERGDIDQRLERRPRLAQRLSCAVVGRTDHVEPALHGEDPPGANFLGKKGTTDFGDRSKRIAVAADRLGDHHHARLQRAERGAPASAFGLLCG